MGNMIDQNQNQGHRGIPYAGQNWLVEERDACGVGFIANQNGKATHSLIQKALPALTCLEHRGGCSADQDSGDGAGLTENCASRTEKLRSRNAVSVQG